MPPRQPADQELAYVLRELRERSGRSQEAVAHDAGLTVGALGRIERGESNPTWSTVRQIAQALDVPLAEISQAVEDRDR